MINEFFLSKQHWFNIEHKAKIFIGGTKRPEQALSYASSRVRLSALLHTNMYIKMFEMQK